METSLIGFLSLLTILALILFDQKATILRLVCLGLVAGLAFLARVDACFLLLVIGIFIGLRWGIYRAVFFGFVAFMVVLPWWLYAFKTFGTIVPESGAAVRDFLMVINKPRSYLSLSSFYAMIEWFPLFKESAFTTFFGIVLTSYLIARVSYRAGAYGLLLFFTLLLQWVFYTFYFQAFWFLTRYYYVIYAVILIAFSLALAEEKRVWAKLIFFGFFALVFATYLVELRSFFLKPKQTPEAKLESLKGYREVALKLSQHLSPGDVIGSFQSGALGYYAPSFVRVLNLDGVVNSRAAEALKRRAMKNYIDAEHMNRFADWEYNSYLFQSVYGGPFPSACFNVLYQAPKQGAQIFLLRSYRPSCSDP